MLTPWKPGRTLVDPFCGSGTFLIEAAMMAANIAPGMKRHFTSEAWTNLIPSEIWEDIREEARDAVDLEAAADTTLQGYDIDPDAVDAARMNAKLAGVESLIHFQVRPVQELASSKKFGFIITNPPYGERLEAGARGGEKLLQGMHPKKDRIENFQAKTREGAQLRRATEEELQAIYGTLGYRFKQLDSWSMYMITSYEDAEKRLGFKAQKNRKIYNGMIKTYFYMFPGPKPKFGDR